jgi:very-short-patch-repair endonuclease
MSGVRAFARRQHWVVTFAQLLALGVSRDAIAWAIRRGILRRLHRGVFLVGPETPPPLALEAAAILAAGKGAVLSHESAAYLHAVLPQPAQPVHVSVVGRVVDGRRNSRIHNTTTLGRADIRRHEGLRITTPARTLLDLAATRTPAELEPLVAEAMRRLRMPERALRAQLDRNPGARGTRALRTVLDGPTGPAFTRSAAERRLRRLLRDAGLPAPLSNATVDTFEVDLLWADQRMIAELDGFAFHRDRQAFEADRRRDATLHSLGYVVLGITWRRLVDEPHAVVALVAAMLERRAAA